MIREKKNCHTVNPCAINSSGTSSGRKTAGVIQGHFVLTGSNVTITSPFAKNLYILMLTFVIKNTNKIQCHTESFSHTASR